MNLTEISKKLNEEMADSNFGKREQQQYPKEDREQSESRRLSSELQISDDSMHTAQMSSSSSLMGIPTTFSTNDLAEQKTHPSSSSTSSQYLTAASSLTQLEAKEALDPLKKIKPLITENNQEEVELDLDSAESELWRAK